MNTMEERPPNVVSDRNVGSNGVSDKSQLNYTKNDTKRKSSSSDYQHGIQIINEDKDFSPDLSEYLRSENVTQAGFNYHAVSVFGSQSSGKSTLLNLLFGTNFGVMSEVARQQTTNGIWLATNKSKIMAPNVLVMDVEGTDGRERGENQEFERKAALFALSVSEVLIMNIWEHQVGLYQGANIALLKIVFEVNLQLFGNDSSKPKSLLFFVIRDHTGITPLSNLRQTIMASLESTWRDMTKPEGLESAEIHDHFDFDFVGLPHKHLQKEQFDKSVDELRTRFTEGFRNASDTEYFHTDRKSSVFLNEYHRRIPADGFPAYAEGIWQTVVENKELDLPAQQVLLAQFRCDDISREVSTVFEQKIEPLRLSLGEDSLEVLPGLGKTVSEARSTALGDFVSQASRYQKDVFGRKLGELEEKLDAKLQPLVERQLKAAFKSGVASFAKKVSIVVRAGQQTNGSSTFANVVNDQKESAITEFKKIAQETVLTDRSGDIVSWSSYDTHLKRFVKVLDDEAAQLRVIELRRLSSRFEMQIKSKINEIISTEFNAKNEDDTTDRNIWDNIWDRFVSAIRDVEEKFLKDTASFDAQEKETTVSLWKLRRRSWQLLKLRLREETNAGSLVLKLKEYFDSKFSYDDKGVPRIWKPTDDMETVFQSANKATLDLLSILSNFQLGSTSLPPNLAGWIGQAPEDQEIEPADYIGGVDGETTLEDEMTLLNTSDLDAIRKRTRRVVDSVYTDAKRGAIGAIAQIPLYFYVILLALGWNEIMAVLSSPMYFAFLLTFGVFGYMIWTLNLWMPLYNMANAASQQGIESAKDRLRQFLEEDRKRPIAMRSSAQDEIPLQDFNEQTSE